MTPSRKSASKKSNEKILSRTNIRISGSGGQGIISTGMLLGEAIAIGDGKNVTQSQSYGPEARGGATRADVIVSNGEIYFPECNDLDILLAFTYEAYAFIDRCCGRSVPDTVRYPRRASAGLASRRSLSR